MKILVIFIIGIISTFFSTPITKGINMYKEIETYIAEVEKEFNKIDSGRKAELKEIAVYVSEKISNGNDAELIFICTHNSRRSHMAQIWAQTAAYHYGFGDKLNTYSGGTEGTAFNPRAVKAIEQAGFKVTKGGESKNPIYHVAMNDNVTMDCFSKKYTHKINPQKNFAAVMVCSDADEACPVVYGAEERVAIPYEDPKKFDGTDQEEEKYNERCRQIAREMMYAFSLVELNDKN